MSILLGLIAILIAGFFDGSETSYTRANWIRLTTWSRFKRFGAEKALQLIGSKEKILVTTLIGSNLFIVLASVTFSNYFIANLGPNYAWLAAVIVIILSLIFSQFLPKTVAQAFPDHWACIVSYLLFWLTKIFSPATYILSSFARLFASPLTRSVPNFASLSRKDFIVALREYDRSRPEKSDRISHLSGIAARLFEFGRMKVKEVALPLSRAVTVPEQIPLDDLYERIKKYSFSRYPVYRDTPENITGVLYTKDLLFLPHQRIRQPYFVSSETRAMEVLTEMRHRGEHLAIVKNQDNKITGIVTLEDLIEELIGEIRSERA
jgi:magnesium and cobalt exporter, CNNM family